MYVNPFKGGRRFFRFTSVKHKKWTFSIRMKQARVKTDVE